MSYPYSQVNRLEQPHSYMYTPFQGRALLQSYESDRMAFIFSRANIVSCGIEPDCRLLNFALPLLGQFIGDTLLEFDKKFRVLFEGTSDSLLRQCKRDASSVKAISSHKFTTTKELKSLDLLHALIAALLIEVHDADTKAWLDRLVQRFEVTKKIYESYPPGFKKGTGANASVRLYWLFALALSLFYVRSNEIKYLSTLLKVNDLLCSLPKNVINGHIPERGLSAVLAAEVVSIQRLAEKQKVGIATK
jgi:hypothetical protein